MNAIEVKNLCKIYNQNKPNEFCALKNINLSVKSGELVILKGVSGSGKSTLLGILGALSKPSANQRAQRLKAARYNELKFQAQRGRIYISVL